VSEVTRELICSVFVLVVQVSRHSGVYLLAHGLAAEVDQLGGVLLGHASLEGDACTTTPDHR